MTAARRPSRRAVIAGVAGLVVGAGAAVGGETVTAGPPQPASRPPTPGEALMTEHGVLKRLLLAYRAASAEIGAGMSPPAGAILDAAQIISDYVESFHEGIEEAYVFPRVAADGQHAELITTLLTQHDRGRHLTAAITAIAGADLTATTRATLKTYLDQFTTMYEPHEAWEDTVVYPALRAVTPQRTLDELAERIAELQQSTYSDLQLDVILDRVVGVEQQLQIENIAAFTPPTPSP